MKKVLFMIGVVVASLQVTTARAQAYMGTGVAEDDKMIFNHLSAGVTLGSDGWGLEVAAPLTPYVAVRTGFTNIPTITFSVKDIDTKKYATDSKAGPIDVDFKLKMTNWKLLFDVYPSQNSGFHFTLGAYIGGDEFVSAKYDDPTGVHKDEYIKVGEKRVAIDNNGHAEAAIKVNSFKPYLGLGFGRAVKKAPGLSFSFDAGVQFWGTPKLWGTTTDGMGTYSYEEINVEDADNADAKEAAKWLTKLKVWPTLSFRLTYTFL